MSWSCRSTIARRARLSPFEDIAGSDFAGAGTAGVRDIVAALEWVRDNIANFGGDAGNVTIFGESGGGAKVSVLMALPSAKGLFHKAIIQSGPALQMATREDGTKTARQFLAELGLGDKDAAKLRSLPVDRSRGSERRPGIGSRRLDRRPAAAGLQSGDRRYFLSRRSFRAAAPAASAEVPLMIGSNKDEQSLFLGHLPWVIGATFDNLPEAMKPYLGERSSEIVAGYRAAQPALPADQLGLIIVGDLGVA